MRQQPLHERAQMKTLPHHPFFRILIAALAVGCGGTTELNGDGDTNGSGGTGDTGGGGTGPTTIGTTSGTTTVSSTTASSTTGPNCAGLDCAFEECPDGRLEVPPGQCCPVCTCENVECELPVCPSGQTVIPEGHCCPQCVDLSCSGVMCGAQTDCPDGRSWTRPDGACCAGCMPDEPEPL